MGHFSARNQMGEGPRLLVDCDNALGLALCDVDDGVALTLALGSHSARIEGVSTTYGNTGVDKVWRQTKKLLAASGFENIPVWRGARFAGDRKTAAARALAAAVANAPNALTLVALGPLTNVAAAASYDPGFFDKILRIVIMGGHRQPLRRGLKSLKEFNIAADPVAASEVLRAPCPVDIVDADVCMQTEIDAHDVCRIAFETGTPPWIVRALRHWIGVSWLCGAGARFVPWDGVAMLAALDPSLFLYQPVSASSCGAGAEAARLRYSEPKDSQDVRLVTILKDRDAVALRLHSACARLYGRKARICGEASCNGTARLQTA